MSDTVKLSDLMVRVTMTCKKGAPAKEEMQDMDGWTCTLKYQGRKYTLPFYMGKGHNGAAPNAFGVMDCILSDAAGWESADGFEDWAGEYGYDTDSRKAEKIYKAVEKGRNKLETLLGEDYETFLYADRD